MYENRTLLQGNLRRAAKNQKEQGITRHHTQARPTASRQYYSSFPASDENGWNERVSPQRVFQKFDKIGLDIFNFF